MLDLKNLYRMFLLSEYCHNKYKKLINKSNILVNGFISNIFFMIVEENG